MLSIRQASPIFVTPYEIHNVFKSEYPNALGKARVKKRFTHYFKINPWFSLLAHLIHFMNFN